MATGQTTVSATTFSDSEQNLIPVGSTIFLQPVDPTTRQPFSYRSGGVSPSLRSSKRVSVGVTTAGAFSIELDDTALTQPANVAYLVTAEDQFGRGLLGAGILIQPTGATWTFEANWSPEVPTLAVVYTGAAGQGFADRGLWAANTAYHPYDVYTQAGTTYRVSTAYTSGSTFGSADTTNSLVMASAGQLTGTQAGQLVGNGQNLVRNIFDNTRAVNDELISYADGTADTSLVGQSYFSTSFMAIGAATQLIANANTQYGSGTFGWAFYDASQAFISGVAGVAAGTAITVPANAVYVRVGFGDSAAGGAHRAAILSSLMIVPGASLPGSYIAFGAVDSATASTIANAIALNSCKQAAVAISATQNLVQNIFDPSTVANDQLVTYATGQLDAAPGGSYFATGYMGVGRAQNLVASANSLFGITSLGWAFYDAAQDYISGIEGVSAGTAVAVPSGAVYARAGFGTSTASGADRPGIIASLMVVTGSTLPSSYISFGTVDTATATGIATRLATQVATQVATAIQPPIRNLFNPAAATPDVIVREDLGTVDSIPGQSYFTTDYMFVAGLTHIIANLGTPGLSQYSYTFYDINKNYIGGVVGQITASTPVAVPSGAAYVRVPYGDGTASGAARPGYLAELMVVPGTTLPTRYVSFALADQAFVTALRLSRWYGKRLGIQGDSIIANGSGQAVAGYQIPVATALGASLVIDAGASGRQMTAALTDSAYTSLITETSIQNCDLFWVALGTNDFGNAPQTPIGALTDTTNATFMGSIDAVINRYIGWNPALRLVFSTPSYRGVYTGSGTSEPAAENANGLGFTLYDYATAIQQKCAQYGLPCIDILRCGGMIKLILSTATIGDNLHPNGAGYELLAPYVAAQLAAL